MSCADDALSARHPRLISQGETVSLVRLPDYERIPDGWLDDVDGAAMRWGAHGWAHVAATMRRRRLLRVTVLGTSPTSGCGSDEPWDPGGPNATSPLSQQRAWPRRMADEIVSELSAAERCASPQRRRLNQASAHHEHRAFCPAGVRVGVRVESKNAVPAEYFSHCTPSLVQPNMTDLVVLEVRA